MRSRPARMLVTTTVAGFCLLVGAAAASADVRLNEINCEGTDWVELVNTSAADADISGWVLTDKPLDSTDAAHRLVFPAATTVPANGLLVVEKGASGFPFGISCGDDTIKLGDASGTQVDSYVVPAQAAAGDTFGRYPSGTGDFAETVPTKGAGNVLSSAGGGPPADQAQWLFDPAQVVSIDLSLPQASRDALAGDPDTYVRGTFSLTGPGGTYGPLDVGIRLKGGAGSFRDLDHKAAFKLKFNEFVAGQRFLGLKKLTLNNMVQDMSMLHETLAYSLFRALGVAAPRTGFAYVKVDGDDYGLHLDVETPDDVSLARWFPSTQHLYEGEYSEDVTAGGAGAFEVDEGSEADHSDLDALIGVANQTSGDWSDGMAAVADLREMTRTWAVEKYIGHWDGYSGDDVAQHFLPNNYFLHSDAGGRFSMLPWGTDETWDQHLQFDGAANGILYSRCLADASCAALYRAAVQEVVAALPALDLDKLAADTAALLRPFQERELDESLREEFDMDRVDAAVSDTEDFVAARPAEAQAWLAASDDPPSDPPGNPPAGNPGTVPATTTQTLVTPPPATSALKPLGIGRPSFAGGFVTTRLTLPAAGRVSLRAFSTVRGRNRTACFTQAARAAATSLTLRCRLSADARRRVARGKLHLTLRHWFIPARGNAEMALRRLTLPRTR